MPRDRPGAVSTAVEAKGDVIAHEKFNPNARRWQGTATARPASWGNELPPLRRTVLGAGIALRRWRPMHRATLRGFVDIELPNGLRIDDIAVHVRGGRAWASLPARPVLENGRHVIRDGKPVYARILAWRSQDIADKFSEAVVELVYHAHPDALNETGQ